MKTIETIDSTLLANVTGGAGKPKPAQPPGPDRSRETQTGRTPAQLFNRVFNNIRTHGLDFKKWDAVQNGSGGDTSVA